MYFFTSWDWGHLQEWASESAPGSEWIFLIEKPGLCVGLRFFTAIPFQSGRCSDLSVSERGLAHSGNEGVPLLNCSARKAGSFIRRNAASRPHSIDSWRPCEGPKWKTLLPIFIFVSQSQVTTNTLCRLGRLLCHTCQLLMEILIATIKYFSRTCPQIHYHSCWSGSWAQAINLEEGL